ncbi:MAG: hypothetical protein ACHQRM_03165 [Bacteroidia bacterium]
MDNAYPTSDNTHFNWDKKKTLRIIDPGRSPIEYLNGFTIDYQILTADSY